MKQANKAKKCTLELLLKKVSFTCANKLIKKALRKHTVTHGIDTSSVMSKPVEVSAY